MEQEVQPKAEAAADKTIPAQPVGSAEPPDQAGEQTSEDHARDARITRLVHIILGLVIAGLAAWLLYRSRTELAFLGANNEPGPGYFPVLLTICLIGLGLALVAVWLWGPKARSGDVPLLSLQPRHIARAMLVWLTLVVFAVLLEPLGFLIAGEVLALLVIVVVERVRSVGTIVALLLLTPAMYLLFVVLLELQLPGGTLWQ
jgi:putative tricarboxylic transport membrane protein